MRKLKKQNKLMFLLLILLGLTIGYAFVSTTLKIDGILGLKGNRFDIHWENIKVTKDSAEATTPAEITDDTTVEFAVTLNKPGEFYEFTVDAVNSGTVNGEIDTISFDVYDAEGENKLDDEDIPSYISKSFGLSNGNEIVNPHVLAVGRREKYKIRVEYTEDIEEKDLEKDFNCVFKASVKYKQSKSASSSTGNLTFIANTDTSKKGLIGIAYVDPTDYSITCNPNEETERMPLYVATSNANLDSTADPDYYPWNYYDSATSWASSNDGCMKWYVYKDTGDSYKLLLDHNTTVVTTPVSEETYYDYETGDSQSGAYDYCYAKYNSEDDIRGCVYFAGQVLKRDTRGWEDEEPTMISDQEIVKIIEDTDSSRLDEYQIELDNGYEWLIDNVEDGYRGSCFEPSCYVRGYWTAGHDILLPGESDDSAQVTIGHISYDESNEKYYLYREKPEGPKSEWIGIRPVITVPIDYFNN